MQGKGAHSLEIKYLHTCEKYTIVITLLNVGEGKPPHYKVRITQLETALTIPWRPGRDMIQRIVQKIKIINKKIITNRTTQLTDYADKTIGMGIYTCQCRTFQQMNHYKSTTGGNAAPAHSTCSVYSRTCRNARWQKKDSSYVQCRAQQSSQWGKLSDRRQLLRNSWWKKRSEHFSCVYKS